MRLLLTLLCLALAAPALAGDIQNFTTVDQYGHVQMGTVLNQSDGSQVYQWNDSTGRHQTDTGYISPPVGDQRTYSTYDGDTGRSSVGQIYGVKPGQDLLLPSSPGESGGCVFCAEPGR